MSDSRAKAVALLDAVQSALAGGVLHYNRAGKLLTTAAEILECLVEEGEVTVSEINPIDWAHINSDKPTR